MTMDFKDLYDQANAANKNNQQGFFDLIGNNIPFLNAFVDELNKNQAAKDAYASFLDQSDLSPEEKNKYYAELAEYTKRKGSEFKQSTDNFNNILANNPWLAYHPALFIPIALGTYFGPSILEALRASSPVILDLDSDGVETISLSDGVYFDHDGNAFAEKSGWVGKDDGLLVLDINQDGNIDSGRELFGNNTYLKDGTLAKNGYLALQELDDDHNGKIDSADAIWQQLNVWQDKNSNGKVDSGELLSLDSLKISSIATGYTNSTLIDDNGNTHQQNSSFTFNDGTRGASSDVWFDVNKGDTRSNHSQPLPDDILAMRYIRGFGNMTDLQTAMADNSELEALVRQAIASQNDIDVLTDQIIYAWAGVSNTVSGSRGAYIDARQLAVLEVATGEDYRSTVNGTVNPLVNAGKILSEEYQIFHDYVSSMILAQTIYKEELSLITPTFKNDLSGFTLNFSAFNIYLEGLKESDVSRFLNLVNVGSGLLAYTPQFSDESGLLSSCSQHYIVSHSADEKLIGHNNISDHYIFAAGHGKDTVNESASKEEQSDTLHFTGVNATAARFSKQGSNLVIQAYGADDAVTVSGYFSSSSDRFLHFAFDDKTLSLADIEAMKIGVSGAEGNNVLTSSHGNGTLSDSADPDTYQFARSQNQDAVYDSAVQTGSVDTLKFTDAEVQDLWFSRKNSHLMTSQTESNDSIMLNNVFSGSAWQNKVISLDDDQSQVSEQVQMLIDAMATFGNRQSDSLTQNPQMKESVQGITSSSLWAQSE
ncbi:hypothetical protein GE278_02705 [Enterobacteriaceae bacterium Kacie_13]|nr:hypothetical protein GE278_02705 [Enterobacteriaceae bacterium Kacie_13]